MADRSRERAARGRARRLPPAERRAQLLACALRVFAQRGLGGAHHAEIAREGGVSLSSAFVYFPTRAALVEAVLDEVERFYLALAEQIHQRDLPAPRVLWEHAVAFAESVDAHPDYARVWLDWSTAIRDEVWLRYLSFQERLVRILQKTVARGQQEGHLAADVDTEDIARVLVSSAHMVAQMKFTRCAPERVERFMRTVIRAALGGVLS
ncbi:MAG: TetR/AcrR family transcriptional regulator, partial [Candidatus Binatia bacterium]|nr:TetR/AcrR family transcriptional regulator [Candidatus Binatia bacterium]